jgi:outer membrane lipoprotein-sorting protein
MRKILLISIVVFMLSLCSCSSKNRETKDVTSYLKELNSYSVDMDIQVKNDKQKLDYNGRQIYAIGLGYRLELNNNRVMIYSGDKIYVSDLNNKQKYVTDKQFDDVLKLSFLGQYIGLLYTNEEIERSYEVFNNEQYELIGTSIPSNNTNISYGVLYVKLDGKLPEKLIIYDAKDKETFLVTYKNFIPNKDVNRALFDLN